MPLPAQTPVVGIPLEGPPEEPEPGPEPTPLDEPMPLDEPTPLDEPEPELFGWPLEREFLRPASAQATAPASWPVRNQARSSTTSRRPRSRQLGRRSATSRRSELVLDHPSRRQRGRHGPRGALRRHRCHHDRGGRLWGRHRLQHGDRLDRPRVLHRYRGLHRRLVPGPKLGDRRKHGGAQLRSSPDGEHGDVERRRSADGEATAYRAVAAIPRIHVHSDDSMGAIHRDVRSGDAESSRDRQQRHPGAGVVEPRFRPGTSRSARSLSARAHRLPAPPSGRTRSSPADTGGGGDAGAHRRRRRRSFQLTPLRPDTQGINAMSLIEKSHAVAPFDVKFRPMSVWVSSDAFGAPHPALLS